MTLLDEPSQPAMADELAFSVNVMTGSSWHSVTIQADNSIKIPTTILRYVRLFGLDTTKFSHPLRSRRRVELTQSCSVGFF